MFKEAFIGVILFAALLFLCRQIDKKNRKISALLVTASAVVFCIANMIYNGIVMFPDYYMDTRTGVYRYGTFSGNLFSYSDQFRHQDNILFPILKNRCVRLDSSAGFYEKFFSLYANSCESMEISTENCNTVLQHREDFSFSHPFTCIGIMDYAKDSIPEALEADFEEKKYPYVYIHTDSLKGEKSIVAVMDKNYDLYIMSHSYYQQITGGTAHE